MAVLNLEDFIDFTIQRKDIYKKGFELFDTLTNEDKEILTLFVFELIKYQIKIGLGIIQRNRDKNKLIFFQQIKELFDK